MKHDNRKCIFGGVIKYVEIEAISQWVQLPEEGAGALRVTTGRAEALVREAAMVSTTPCLKENRQLGKSRDLSL